MQAFEANQTLHEPGQEALTRPPFVISISRSAKTMRMLPHSNFFCPPLAIE